MFCLFIAYNYSMVKNKLQEQQIAALKSNDGPKLEVLRYILSQVQNKEIEKQSELTDEEVIQTIKKIGKELKESLESAQKAGRQDLIEKHRRELEIVSIYLPKELSDEQLETEVKKLAEENKSVAQQNPKALIGICMKALQGKADPGRILEMIQKLELSV